MGWKEKIMKNSGEKGRPSDGRTRVPPGKSPRSGRGDGAAVEVRKAPVDELEIYQLMAEKANDGIIILSEGRRLYFNRKYMELAGYDKPEDLVKAPFLSTIHPDDHDRVRDVIGRRQAGETAPLRYECRFQRPDGSVIPVEISAALIDYRGKRASLGYVREITDQKRLMEALHESEKKYRSVVENMPETYYRTDREGRLVLANPAGATMFGYDSASDLMGVHVDTFWLDTSERKKLIEGGLPVKDYETAMVRKDGTPVQVSLSFNYYSDDRGEILGTEGIIRDISDRVKAEAALGIAREKFSAAFQGSPVALCFSDLETGRILEINETFSIITGYSREEVVERVDRDLQLWKDPADRQHFFSAVLEREQCLGIESRILCRDGTVKEVRLSSRIVRFSGVSELLTVMEDLTELKRQEARFSSLVEKSLDVISLLDENGIFLYNTPSVEKIFWYPREVLRGRCAFDFIHPDDLDIARGAFNDLANNLQDGIPTEFRFRKADGSWIHLEALGNNLLQDSGVGGIVIISRDVTERKRVEGSLRKSEELYTKLVATMPDVVIRTDMLGNVLYVNDAALEISGYGRGEIEGRNMLEFIAPEDRERALENTALMLQERLGPREYHLVFKSGEQRLFEVNGDVLRDENGVPYGLVQVCRDITERREAEDRLVESQRRLRTFIDSTTDLVFLKDDRYRHLLANRALCSFFGKDEEDVVGRSDFDLMPEDSAAQCRRSDRAALTSRSVQVIEEKGGDGYFESLKFPVELADGRIGVGGFIRDITGRKKMEQQLQKVSREWEEIFQAIGQPTLVLAPDHTILGANRAVTQVLNKPLQDVVGGKCHDFFHSGGAPPPECPLRKARATGKVETVEMLIDQLDGNYLVSCTPFFDEAGNLEKIIHIATDMTDKVKTERALRESEAKYRSIFEDAVEGIYQTTPEGRFMTVNPAMARMTGYGSPDEMIASVTDMAIQVYVDPEDSLKFGEIMARNGVVSGYEVEWRKKDGSVISVVLNVRAVKDGQGRVLYHEGIAEDITGRKRLETQLVQAQKLNAIGTLAGGIAHDFNNLMMGIIGHASLLSMGMEAGHPQYERIKGIEDLVRSGARLTGQLLDFARGGSRVLKPLDLNEVMDKNSDMFGRTKKEIFIHKKFEEPLWTVKADQGQIEQILMNLFVNAWQAMPGGGNLYLETRNVTLDGRDVRPYGLMPGRYVKFSVTDTGVGMDDKTKARLFEPFFTTREMGRGTGLGLATVYGIVRGHQGIITVYSKQGHGTAFHVYLPASAKDMPREDVSFQELRRGRETILVVDDETTVADVTKGMLENLGYGVLTAGSGGEALEIFRSAVADIDLVILDMIMPGMGGEETYEGLKEIRPDIPVILSSGYSLNGQTARIEQLGCRAFLQKPFLMTDLSRSVRKILDSP